MGAAEWGMLILLGAIWGGSFFFARVAVSEIPPLTLVLLRVAIAGAALHLYLLLRGPSFALALPHWPMFVALGILNNAIPFSLIFLGQTALGAGIASVLNATTPFWTIVIANAVTSDEKLSWKKVVGVLFGIAGTAVMIGPGVVAGLGGPVWAKFALIGASISYALALMVARRLKGIPPVIVAAGQLTVSTIVMVPVALLVSGTAGLFAASTHVWAAVFGLALLSTAFAYLLYFTIVARAGATNASLVTLIVPVSAILLGAGFLGERLELFDFAGMALIAAGLLTIDGRLLPKRRAAGPVAG
ncbi:DMT family transporter [Mesorhizobium sp. BAC0120]|uniref:DMT family transporter n=1 Tax=Mesorhizobium sp. BAC0120 TaxID=3090670 RepID=UPI00298BCF5B|nr:DMT family transporter [Mesorhizobium sp. BAC0120]MDW6020819.1 DMT family transporter [Mesorhizobium sp. BAC0120]